MGDVILVPSEEEAIALSLTMNRENDDALWLYGLDSKLGWFVENWRSLER